MNTLLTLGCSWTLGIGANYTEGMSDKEYFSIRNQPPHRNNAFRLILADHYNLNNQNLGIGGSSNQRQFRLAKEYFFNGCTTCKENWKKIYNKIKDSSWPDCPNFRDFRSLPDHVQKECINVHKIVEKNVNPDIVIWSLTSIYRNETWNNSIERFHNFMYGSINEDHFSKYFLKNIHDDINEIEELANNMLLWNSYFKSKGIKNIWVDTFNIHDYPYKIDNLIRPDDLLTGMLRQHTDISDFKDDSYHMSNWHIDSDKIKTALEYGLVNPYSLHPTKKGHESMAKFLIPFIDDIINK